MSEINLVFGSLLALIVTVFGATLLCLTAVWIKRADAKHEANRR